MFYMSPGGHGDPKFNQDISRWNTAAVTNMTGMFAELTAFNQDLSTWNVMAVTKNEAMFYRSAMDKEEAHKPCTPTGVGAGGTTWRKCD